MPMEPEQNLHALVPPALLEKARARAEQEHITLDELVREALAGRLQERSVQRLHASGEGAPIKRWSRREQEVDWSQCPLVEIDPEIQSGAPVLRGTRMPVDAAAPGSYCFIEMPLPRG
jgi:Protein of unknown function (DUF433)